MKINKKPFSNKYFYDFYANSFIKITKIKKKSQYPYKIKFYKPIDTEYEWVTKAYLINLAKINTQFTLSQIKVIYKFLELKEKNVNY